MVVGVDRKKAIFGYKRQSMVKKGAGNKEIKSIGVRKDENSMEKCPKSVKKALKNWAKKS